MSDKKKNELRVDSLDVNMTINNENFVLGSMSWNPSSLPPPTLEKIDLEKEMHRRCHHCSQFIDIVNENFYTIGKEPSRHNKVTNKSKQRIYFFHSSCFEKVAGERFM